MRTKVTTTDEPELNHIDLTHEENASVYVVVLDIVVVADLAIIESFLIFDAVDLSWMSS